MNTYEWGAIHPHVGGFMLNSIDLHLALWFFVWGEPDCARRHAWWGTPVSCFILRSKRQKWKSEWIQSGL